MQIINLVNIEKNVKGNEYSINNGNDTNTTF